jgi:putative ATPase
MSDEPDLFSSVPARGRGAAPDTPGGGRTQGKAPLAERMRPTQLAEYVGQEHLVGPGRLVSEMLGGRGLHSLILWGPPGSGKTTLARLIAEELGLPFAALSAVLAGVKDLRAIFDRAELELRARGKPLVLFIDEIHRFNKAQQDALLPHVERGTIVLIGATTENPSFEVIAPLLSRSRVLTLTSLGPVDLGRLIDRALADAERGLAGLRVGLAEDARRMLVEHAQGDARIALGTLELAAELAARTPAREVTVDLVAEAAQRRALRYDRAGEEHYNVISAFIKSLRGSDPDAALYWLVRMLEAGEDPLFIARRMVIFASEDIGNADPRALQVAVAVKDAVHFIGLPEGRIPLAQGVTYLATAPKSNASYAALGKVSEEVARSGTLAVPLHLRNAPTPLMRSLGYAEGYRYPHAHPGHFVAEEYLPEALRGRVYYEPSEEGPRRRSAAAWPAGERAQRARRLRTTTRRRGSRRARRRASPHARRHPHLDADVHAILLDARGPALVGCCESGAVLVGPHMILTPRAAPLVALLSGSPELRYRPAMVLEKAFRG